VGWQAKEKLDINAVHKGLRVGRQQKNQSLRGIALAKVIVIPLSIFI
jgi:hypothetical protein